MNKRIKRFLNNREKPFKYKIFGERGSIKRAFFQNYLYGFTGILVPVAVWMENVLALAIALLCFYSVLSTVINREKYTTNLGKYFYFPFPAMLGGVSGFLLGSYIKDILNLL